MNLQQASKLMITINEEMPEVEATIIQKRANRCMSYQINCFLPCAQLRLSVNDVEDWPSVKDAWQGFLPGADLIKVEERPKKYLVSGIPMTIIQRADGYWFGSFTRRRKTIKHYLGKVDPRPQLQEVSV